jgi:hypothetical protein
MHESTSAPVLYEAESTTLSLLLDFQNVKYYSDEHNATKMIALCLLVLSLQSDMPHKTFGFCVSIRGFHNTLQCNTKHKTVEILRTNRRGS